MKSGTKAGELREACEAQALATLDTALAAASHRGSYTREEMVGLVNDVVAAVQEPDLVGPVLEVVDRLLVACADQAIVDRGFVVDALLDVRLALSPLHDLI
jgi:hypothetical protein